MDSKSWSALFGVTLIPIAAMIVFAFIGNTTISLICLAVSFAAFLLARIVEMKGVDLGIIWICGIIATFCSL